MTTMHENIVNVLFQMRRDKVLNIRENTKSLRHGEGCIASIGELSSQKRRVPLPISQRDIASKVGC